MSHDSSLLILRFNTHYTVAYWDIPILPPLFSISCKCISHVYIDYNRHSIILTFVSRAYKGIMTILWLITELYISFFFKSIVIYYIVTFQADPRKVQTCRPNHHRRLQPSLLDIAGITINDLQTSVSAAYYYYVYSHFRRRTKDYWQKQKHWILAL